LTFVEILRKNPHGRNRGNRHGACSSRAGG
jgi:hypothetical protein